MALSDVDGVAWERLCYRLIMTAHRVLPYPNQNIPLIQSGAPERQLHNSTVIDGDPAWGRTTPLYHILVVAACRVGLSAVLEVVGQHGVPAVRLLRAVRERQRPVALDLLQRRVVKGRQVLLGAGQKLLLFVGIILGLLGKERGF